MPSTSTRPLSGTCRAHRLLELGYAGGGGTVAPFDIWWRDLTNDPEYDPNLCMYVKHESGTMIALAQCWTSAFVKDLVVHPGYRRRGVGRMLLLHVFAEFKARLASSVRLKVERNNLAAMRFYRSVGMHADR